MRSLRLRWLGVAALAALPAALATAQTPGSFNVRRVAPSINVQDKEDIWALHFNFKDPRTITVDVPGRGRKIVWYMWYQVVNQTAEPRLFVPKFELVTLDRKTAHTDEILPSVQEAIRRLEAPTMRPEDFKNSVTVSEKPIPPTPADSAPRAVTGVAIWPDVYDRAKDTTNFSVFVNGLSNGYSVDERGQIRRKTLQLNFRRAGDGSFVDGADVRFVEPPQWIYRATNVDVSATEIPGAKREEAKPAEPKAEPGMQ